MMYCIIGASQVGSIVMTVKEGAHLKKVLRFPSALRSVTICWLSAKHWVISATL